MLHEYVKLAKSVDLLTENQAKQIIGSVLDKLKESTGAIIVDLWVREPGADGIDILVNRLRRSAPQTPTPAHISLTRDAKGLLAWVVEERKSVWLQSISPSDQSGTNSLTGQTIEGRHFKSTYDRTRAFAAVPIERHGHCRAILSVEVDTPARLKDFHIDLMETLVEPTGIIIRKANAYEESHGQTNDTIEDFQHTTRLPSILNPYRTGFVARPFEDRFGPISKAIARAFEARGIRTAAYRPGHVNKLVVQEMLEQIISAHFGIADITTLNNNVLVELGILIGAGKPLMIIRNKDDEGIPLPFDIAGYNYYLYQDNGEEIVISDGESLGPLQHFMDEFIDKLLSERAFQEAKEWTPPKPSAATH